MQIYFTQQATILTNMQLSLPSKQLNQLYYSIQHATILTN